jgi:hypothetical protein
MAEMVFQNQGRENDGWVTDEFIRAAARSVGLDAAKLLADRNSAFVANAIAGAAGLTQAPSFELGQTGQELRGFEPSRLDLRTFKTAVEEQLHR